MRAMRAFSNLINRKRLIKIKGITKINKTDESVAPLRKFVQSAKYLLGTEGQLTVIGAHIFVRFTLTVHSAFEIRKFKKNIR